MTGVNSTLPESSQLLWTPQVIAGGVSELATQLDQRFADRPPESDPLLVGVMPEATFFMADLLRKLTYGPIICGFLNISNYPQGSRGHLLRSSSDFPTVTGRNVTFLHTRIMSGFTTEYLNRMAVSQNAASIGHVALIHQPTQNPIAKPDMHALTHEPAVHLFGYGLPYTRSGDGPSHVALSGIYQQLHAEA